MIYGIFFRVVAKVSDVSKDEQPRGETRYVIKADGRDK